MTYRPGKAGIFSPKSFKILDEMNKLLEDELPGLAGHKNSKEPPDDNDEDS